MTNPQSIIYTVVSLDSYTFYYSTDFIGNFSTLNQAKQTVEQLIHEEVDREIKESTDDLDIIIDQFNQTPHIAILESPINTIHDYEQPTYYPTICRDHIDWNVEE